MEYTRKQTYTVCERELHSMKNKHSLDLDMHGFRSRKKGVAAAAAAIFVEIAALLRKRERETF